MGVSEHLGINIAEYDARIRTFIPYYEQMLDVLAAATPRTSRMIVDLGTGTGALAARCLSRAPEATLLGIDMDPEMLVAAARRIPARAEFVTSNFEAAHIPACDAVIASFSLHHIAQLPRKQSLYERIRQALTPNGVLLIADCYPAQDAVLHSQQFAAWKEHLQKSYTVHEAQEYLDAWADEDFYMPLNVEIECLRRAGFDVEVLWRKDAFAVLQASKPLSGIQTSLSS